MHWWILSRQAASAVVISALCLHGIGVLLAQEEFDTSEVLVAIRNFEHSYLQQANDCGPVAAVVLARLEGFDLDVGAFRDSQTQEGIQVETLIRIVKDNCGLRLKPVICKSEDEIPIPSIMILKKNHCVVALKRVGEKLLVFDPNAMRGREFTDADRKAWKGELLISGRWSLSQWISFALVVSAAAVTLGYLSRRK